MAKLIQYSISMIGIMLLLVLVGAPTLSSQLLGMMMGFGSTSGSIFSPITDLGTPTVVIGMSLIFGMIAAAFYFSAALSLFAVNVIRPAESVIIATVCTMLFGLFTADMTSIINLSSSLDADVIGPARAILLLIFIPYAAGFLLSMIAFWRGNDI